MAKGFTLWFTGLSGSGKSTLANLVAKELRTRGRVVDLLDGDVVRQHLSKGLGFSKEDRDTNIRRIGFVAHLITKHGGVAITAAISPYRAIREENRQLIGHFVEVYCECPLKVCEDRDVKGLYAKARKAVADGNPMHFTGVDDPYEAPEHPEIIVDTEKMNIREGTHHILDHLMKLKLLGQTDREIHSSEMDHEHIPEELVEKASTALRNADRVHSEVLMRELHVGFETAVRLIDRLGERGELSQRPKSS